MHPSNKITLENLHDAVYWHQPTPEKAEKYKLIADACFEFMAIMLKHAPDCADRTAALRCAREARMWANSNRVWRSTQHRRKKKMTGIH